MSVFGGTCSLEEMMTFVLDVNLVILRQEQAQETMPFVVLLFCESVVWYARDER